MYKTYKLKLKDDDGQDVVLEVRSNFETLAAIEDACDEGAVQILQQLSSGKFKFSQIATLVHASLVANGDSRRTEGEIGQLIFNVGFMEAIKDQLDEFVCSLVVPKMGAVESGKAKGAASSPGKKS